MPKLLYIYLMTSITFYCVPLGFFVLQYNFSRIVFKLLDSVSLLASVSLLFKLWFSSFSSTVSHMYPTLQSLPMLLLFFLLFLVQCFKRFIKFYSCSLLVLDALSSSMISSKVALPSCTLHSKRRMFLRIELNSLHL